MKLFGFELKKIDKRASASTGRGADAEYLFGAVSNTAAGVRVTVDTATQVAAVYACVRVLSESLASLPLITYEKLAAGGKARAFAHPLYTLLHDQPNEYQTSFEFREMMMAHVVLRGNAFAQIIFNGAGGIESLRPIHPDSIQLIALDSYRYFYRYQGPGNQFFNLRSDEVFHVKGLSCEGFLGESPIDNLKNAIGIAMAADEHGARFFSNNAQPGGLLKYPTRLNPKEQQNLRDSWERLHSGPTNANRVAILENGLEFTPLSVTNEQAQFLQTRQFQISEIARIFRIPPHMIGDLSKSSFSNIEQQSLEFVIHTIRPWAIRWEQAIKRALLTPEEKQKYFSEFLLDALLRGDTVSRGNYYQLARTNGWLNIDEIRELENLNPLPDGLGQTYLQPLNMATLGETETPAEDKSAAEEDDAPDPEDDGQIRAAAMNLFDDLIGRLCRKEDKALERDAKKHNFEQLKKEFREKHRELITETLKAPIGLYFAQYREMQKVRGLPVVRREVLPSLVDQALTKAIESIEARESTEKIESVIRNIISGIEQACISISVSVAEHRNTQDVKLIAPAQDVTVMLERPAPRVIVREMEVKRDETGRMIGAKLREIEQ